MKNKFILILTLGIVINSFSQNVNNKINSGGISNNNINYEVGLINVVLVYEEIEIINNDSLTQEENNISNPNNSNKFNYYPNQVIDKLFLKMNNNFLNNYVEVYNELGQLLINKFVNEESIDLSTLTTGMYLIIIKDENTKPFKILKK